MFSGLLARAEGPDAPVLRSPHGIGAKDGSAETIPIDRSRRAIVERLLARSRLLDDVHFSIPRSVWERYIRETTKGLVEGPPVALIAEKGLYHLTVPPAGRSPMAGEGPADPDGSVLSVTLVLHCFDPSACAGTHVLSTKQIWEDVRVNDKPTSLPVVRQAHHQNHPEQRRRAVEGWLSFSPPKPGSFTITARCTPKRSGSGRRNVKLPTLPTVRTLLRFDSPTAWEVLLGGGKPRLRAEALWRTKARLRGSVEDGTHGQISLLSGSQLNLTYRTPRPAPRRSARLLLSGDVVWNIDVGSQEVRANIDVALAGGGADSIVLTLPDRANRVTVTGPDVRRTDCRGSTANVFLRGWTEGRTRLAVSFQLPERKDLPQRLDGFGVRNGRWADGMLVITNTAESREVVASDLSGLTEVASSEVSESAASMLAGPTVFACRITSQRWSAQVDVIDLGRFALTESIADLAHYTVTFMDDGPSPAIGLRPAGGSICSRAQYEVRNRTRQFLRIRLPKDARVLIARVNEKSVPLTPVERRPDEYLLPLVRSKVSLTGLVSFPVEVVYLARVAPLEKSGTARLPVVGIDIPVAYAWAELYLPDGMKAKKWSGPLKTVPEYSSQTASAMLDYGMAEYAEGYKESARPVPVDAPPRPETSKPRSSSGWDLLSSFRRAEPSRRSWDEQANRARLARNTYRAGVEDYEKGNYSSARASLSKVSKLAPELPEAGKARALLDNIDLIEGKRAAVTKQEKAAAAQVTGEQTVVYGSLERKQEKFLEKGKRALREGRTKEAQFQLEAAEKLSEELIQRGGKRIEQESRVREARKGLAAVRKSQAGEVAGLKARFEEQKSKGEYKKALQSVKRLQELDVNLLGATHETIDELNLKIARAEGEAKVKKTDALNRQLAQDLARTARAKDRPDYLTLGGHLSSSGGSGGGGQPMVQRGDPPAPSTGDQIRRDPRVRQQMEQVQAEREYVEDADAERLARQRLEYSRGILMDDLDRSMEVTRDELNKHLVRMRNIQERQYSRLMEQWEIFHSRKQYNDALAVLQQAELLRPGRADLAGKKNLTLRSRLQHRFARRSLEHATETDARLSHMTEQMTPWSAPFKYPTDWKEHSDRRLRATQEGKEREIPENRRVRQKLEQTTVSFDFNEQPVRDVLEYLGTLGDTSMVLDKSKLVDPAQTLTLKLTNVSLETAVKLLAEQLGMRCVIRDGVVFVSDEDGVQLPPETVTYPVRDLVTDLPEFMGPSFDLGRLSQAKQAKVKKSLGDIQGLVKEVIEPGTWDEEGRGIGIRERGGEIIVTHTPEVQREVQKLLEGLRSRKGQVELGQRIASQRAEQRYDGEDIGEEVDAYDLRKNRELREFLGRTQMHYLDVDSDWGVRVVDDSGSMAARNAMAVEKLYANRGQKVLVSSVNLNVDARDASTLDVTFVKGNNDVNYTVVDEGQLRTLMEMSAKSPTRQSRYGDGARPTRVAGENSQETIVGTDARFANDMAGNIRFAGDALNTLDVNGNAIDLPHERYVLIDNKGFLTAVKAGPMHHWTERIAPFVFFEVPQSIEVPRVGHLVKLEKTLLNPKDKLVISIGYKWSRLRAEALWRAKARLRAEALWRAKARPRSD